LPKCGRLLLERSVIVEMFVPGLTSHSQRPFVLASCSRDSTMRVWSMAPLIQPLEISILAGLPFDKIIAPTGR